MRKDWEVKKLGDIATYVNGYAFKPNQWSDNGLPIIRIQNLNDNNAQYNYCDNDDIPSKYLVNKGDILISWSASLGVYEWLKNTAYLNQHIFKVVFDKLEINKYYFKYAVSSKIDHMVRNAHGATMKHIVKKDFDNTPIYYPPLQIQQQIVEELNCLTSIIEKQKKHLEELDNLAQAIFYDMFGDPIENEKGWSIKKIKDISLSVNYGTSSPSTEDGKYKYLRMNNITAKGTIDLSSIKYINVPPEDLEKYVVRKGDILFNRTNSKELVGKTALYTFEEDMIIAGYIIRLRVIDSIALPIFLSSYLNTSCIKEYFRSIAKGAVNQSNINSKQLLSTSVFIPPLPLQQQFASKIEAIEKQKELIKKSIKETEDLFNSRIDYYFN